MKHLKNFLVITGLLLISIAIGIQCGAVQAKVITTGLVVSTAVDVIFANLKVTVIDLNIIIFAIILLVVSTMIDTKK